MTTCRVLLAKRKQWYAIGSLILRTVEQMDFSHCAIEIDGLIYESVYPYSRMMKKEQWLKKYEIVHSFEKNISDELADLMEVWLSNEMMNKEYSIAQLFLIGVTICSKALEKTLIGIEVDGNRRVICTELVGLWLSKFFNKKWTERQDWLSLKDIHNGASEVFE